jgi:hypothetical protein
LEAKSVSGMAFFIQRIKNKKPCFKGRVIKEFGKSTY